MKACTAEKERDGEALANGPLRTVQPRAERSDLILAKPNRSTHFHSGYPFAGSDSNHGITNRSLIE
jgi:hypothetical protein